MKYTPLFLLVFLFGCGPNVEIPEKYLKTPAHFEITKTDFEHKGRSGSRLAVYVDANVNAQAAPVDRASAAFQIAVKAFEAQKMASVVYVSLHDPVVSKLGGTVSRLRLTPDGCTFSKEPSDCNAAMWTLNNSSKTPTNLQTEIHKLWNEKRSEFQDDGMTNEEALKSFIANELNIKHEEVSLFNYSDYENEELFQ